LDQEVLSLDIIAHITYKESLIQNNFMEDTKRDTQPRIFQCMVAVLDFGAAIRFCARPC
jgi:hypothetical protein